MSAHEALAGALTELAREMDNAQEEGRLRAQGLRDAAKKADLRELAFLNGQGGIVQESGPLPGELQAEAGRFLKSGEGVALRLFPAGSDSASLAYVALRRQGAPGAVLLVLGPEELLAWKTRISIQEAIEVAGWRKGVLYFAVRDAKGGILAQGGDIQPTLSNDWEPASESASETGAAATRRVSPSGGSVLEVAAPFRFGDRIVGETRVGLDPAEMDDLLKANRLQIYLSAAMMALLGLLAVAILYGSQSRHHRRLQEMRDRLHQSERLSALGRLAGVVAHEVRNPLNAISMAVQRMGREYAPREKMRREEFIRITGLVRDEIRRIDKIVEDFLGLTRTSRVAPKPVSAQALLARVRTLLEDEAASRSIRIQTPSNGLGATVYVDQDKIMQALLNIARNAAEAIPASGGTISLGVRPEGEKGIRIEISDTGVGISPHHMDRIFDAGFTTKEKGLGVGLSVAHEIVRLHGGELHVRSEPGQGTTVSVSLPGRAGDPVGGGQG
jgi:signal transduction histidine kinase